jgi:hypothetical protein
MRTVTFDDVRVSADDPNHIIAAPAWAYEPGIVHRGKIYYLAIEAAWVLIGGELKKRAAIAADEEGRRIEAAKAIIGDESIVRDDPRKEEAKEYIAGCAWRRCFPTPRNCVYLPAHGMQHVCRVCGELFFGYGRTRICSDRCARTRRKETHVYSKVPRKPVEHDPRPCDHCHHNFIPTRRDARFCSGRCRVAAHRAGTG